jgi:rubrerythrin
LLTLSGFWDYFFITLNKNRGVQTVFSANELLDMAIKLEKNGEAVYRRAIAKVAKPELAALLAWMADEEVRHARFFSDLKLNLATKRANPIMEEMSRELFDDLMGDKNFCLKEVDFSVLNTTEKLIAVFIEFEKDSVIFYQVLEPLVEDPLAREHLKKIIEEENRHIELLQEFTGRPEVFSTFTP